MKQDIRNSQDKQLLPDQSIQNIQGALNEINEDTKWLKTDDYKCNHNCHDHRCHRRSDCRCFCCLERIKEVKICGQSKTICSNDWWCSWGTAFIFSCVRFYEISWFNEGIIDAFTNFLLAAVPLALALSGVYKNQYVLTKKSQKQEEVLKEQGLE